LHPETLLTFETTTAWDSWIVFSGPIEISSEKQKVCTFEFVAEPCQYCP